MRARTNGRLPLHAGEAMTAGLLALLACLLLVLAVLLWPKPKPKPARLWCEDCEWAMELDGPAHLLMHGARFILTTHRDATGHDCRAEWELNGR